MWYNTFRRETKYGIPKDASKSIICCKSCCREEVLTMEDAMEFRTIKEALEERDRYKDILKLIESGEIEKAVELLKRNIDTIEEALENK